MGKEVLEDHRVEVSILTRMMVLNLLITMLYLMICLQKLTNLVTTVCNRERLMPSPSASANISSIITWLSIGLIPSLIITTSVSVAALWTTMWFIIRAGRHMTVLFVGKRFMGESIWELTMWFIIMSGSHMTVLFMKKTLYGRSYIRTHNVIHHKGRHPYDCPVCEKTFYGRSYMGTHNVITLLLP